MNRYYVKCKHTNCYGEKESINLVADARLKREAKIKIYENYDIDSIVKFTNVKKIHSYSFNGELMK